MVATICLLTCALVPAQPTEGSEWLLTPRLNRGHELVYHGTFSEEAFGNAFQFSRTYRLESRAFVLDSDGRGLNVALLTVLKLRTAGAERGHAADPSSVRLELVHVDPQGKVAADAGVSVAVPFDGPATVECGEFPDLPRGRVHLGQTWEAAEAGRPPRTWRLRGTEVINGTTCLRLEGLQQSEDWDHPRADRAAWRRVDVVWFNPRLGVAYRVERTLERREPARGEPTQRSVTRYELESSLQYPGQLLEDRRREIQQAQAFAESATPLLASPGQHDARDFQALLARISAHLENRPPTPYREAVEQVKRRVEAARRGEPTPAALRSDDPSPSVASLGERAPDFVATNLISRESVRLRRLQGKPILMVFYSPNSATVDEVLRFAEAIGQSQRGAVTVLGFAIADDAERIRKQASELHLSFPILPGRALRQSYEVQVTPKFVVLDAEGVLRGNFEGWGLETPRDVTGELRRWLAAAPAPAPAPTAPPARR